MKQKVAVIIGMSKDAIYTINSAKEHGVFVVGIDGNEVAEGFKYVDKAVIADISNLELVEEIVNEIKPDFTIPVPIGRYLSTTGWINSKFNLRGASWEATLNSIDKYLFHRKLYENRLRNIKAYLIQGNSEKNESYDMVYPAILKPRYGSGSRNVFYIQSVKELNEKIQLLKDEKEDYIFEQAIDGIEYGVDGVVIDGKMQLILVRKKINTPLPIRQAISSIVVSNQSIEFKRIEEKLGKVIKVLQYNNCILNADIIINENDVFIIEISPRPAGHNLHSMFIPEATDVDMMSEYIKFLLDKPAKFTPDRVKLLQIRYFDFEDGVIKKIPTIDKLIENKQCKIIKWCCQIKEGDFMQKVIDGHSIMERGFFVIEGNSEEELIKHSQWILSQFKIEKK